MNKQLKYLKMFESNSSDASDYVGKYGIYSNTKLNYTYIKIPGNLNKTPKLYDKLTDGVYSIDCEQNCCLEYVNSFNNLKEINHNLNFRFNSQLRKISGFDNLIEIGSSLLISSNNLLKQITGFSKIEKIYGSIFLKDNNRLILLSIPNKILKALNWSENPTHRSSFIQTSGYRLFYSPEEFVNDIQVFDNMIYNFNINMNEFDEYGDQVVKQIVENVEEWGTENTKQKVYSYLGQYLTPEQLTKLPDNIKHLYSPEFKNTSVRDVAKFNTGQIYGIF